MAHDAGKGSEVQNLPDDEVDDGAKDDCHGAVLDRRINPYPACHLWSLVPTAHYRIYRVVLL